MEFRGLSVTFNECSTNYNDAQRFINDNCVLVNSLNSFSYKVCNGVAKRGLDASDGPAAIFVFSC